MNNTVLLSKRMILLLMQFTMWGLCLMEQSSIPLEIGVILLHLHLVKVSSGSHSKEVINSFSGTG